MPDEIEDVDELEEAVPQVPLDVDADDVLLPVEVAGWPYDPAAEGVADEDQEAP